MRTVIAQRGEVILPRADEVDYLPMKNENIESPFFGTTWHTFINDEDCCPNKKSKMKLRRQNRRRKMQEREW